MPKLPERYEPGELQNTRKNLGQLSPDEARQMAKKLGGEVGTEKTASTIEDKYQKLRATAPKSGTPHHLERSPARPVVTGGFGNPGRSRVTSSTRRDWPRMKFFDRVRTDFFCARPEIHVKTLPQALATLVSLSADAPDTVSRHFILDGDHAFARGVENLVLAVRGLTSKNNKNALQAIRRLALYNDILKVLRTWDIEGIHFELSRLQARPAGRSFPDFVELLKLLLRPIFLLSKLNVQLHLLPAVQKMFELGRSYLVKTEDRERLMKFYLVARDELPQVFGRLKYRLYPFLLKLLSDKFLRSDPFFRTYEQKLLDFLDIKDTDLLKEPPHGSLAPPIPLDLEAPAASEPAEGDPAVPFPKSALKGLELLDKLFPRAGWKNLETHPDFYAYYEDLFDFPKGIELVSVRDPLQAVYAMSLILQNLFYGFQEMKFGTSKNQFGQVVDLQTEIDKAISQWHFFMEEVFTKNYLNLLQDYCRSVERSGRHANESRRLEHQMLWLKKRYLLAHLTVPVFDDVRPINLTYPPLGAQVKQLISILAGITVEVEQNIKKQTLAGLSKAETKIQSLQNALASLQFPVENQVSRRLNQILRPEARNNRSLLYYTFSILLSLDFLLNHPGSLLYEKTGAAPYRTSGNVGDDIPLYKIDKRDTVAFLKKLATVPPVEAEDPPEELYGPFLVQEEIKKQIQSYHTDRGPFTMVAFKLVGVDDKSRIFFDQQIQSLRELVDSLKGAGQTVGALEDGTIMAVLPGTGSQPSELWARTVLTAATIRRPHPLALICLVLPFQKTWSLEKLSTIQSRGFQLGLEYPPQVMGVFRTDLQAFDFLDDLPVVVDETASLEPDENFADDLDSSEA